MASTSVTEFRAEVDRLGHGHCPLEDRAVEDHRAEHPTDRACAAAIASRLTTLEHRIRGIAWSPYVRPEVGALIGTIRTAIGALEREHDLVGPASWTLDEVIAGGPGYRTRTWTCARCATTFEAAVSASPALDLLCAACTVLVHAPAVLVRDARARLGLTQAQFAARLAVPKRTVENWEQGSRRPPDYLWRALRDLEREPCPAAGASRRAGGVSDRRGSTRKAAQNPPE